jgi:hypothetical protein
MSGELLVLWAEAFAAGRRAALTDDLSGPRPKESLGLKSGVKRRLTAPTAGGRRNEDFRLADTNVVAKFKSSDQSCTVAPQGDAWVDSSGSGYRRCLRKPASHLAQRSASSVLRRSRAEHGAERR